MSTATESQVTLHDCRDAFAATLEQLARADERIVTVANDSVGSSKLGSFRKQWPERLVNVGIAEQSLVGVGAGLANSGLIPFVCAASCFLTGRALEQIKADIAYSQANVKLCGISSGVAYGQLGPTHHSIEDLAWTRVLDGLEIFVPVDDVETAQVIRYVADSDRPAFVRLSRMGVPTLMSEDYQFRPGQAPVLRQGHDITLIGCGVTVCRALEAAEQLAQSGIEARVISCTSIAPLDRDTLLSAARETGHLLTIEEHSVRGGMGSAVAELVAQEAPCRMKLLGFESFAPTGAAGWLLDEAGMSVEGIVTSAHALLK
ncbi:MAG: transketolase family protein [Salinicola sp.]|uniref:transketolase family protein n=1 Tax=Salinicola sp. TaxID=1978524 RepID=UPI001D4727D3|nr:transketolase C-terminal domain-containing protein [Salinicola sp.]NRB58156.1 transketolase family protein [Salinicola sp.]